MKLLHVAVALVLLPVAVSAQYAQDQPRSLKGLNTVFVRFQEPSGKMTPKEKDDVFNALTLELRKAGIRVSRDTTGQNAEGLVNLSLFIRTGLVDYTIVRMDVEQKATLVRTTETLQLVTWYFEDSDNSGSWRQYAPPLVTKATNKFLADWLQANGR
jgi:hypothetical protein